jgi:hypothetical protein
MCFASFPLPAGAQAVHDWARSEGFARVCLVTANPHAAAFYVSLGYSRMAGQSKEHFEIDVQKEKVH